MCFYAYVLPSGACINGNDESTDDHSSADAADSVSPSATGLVATTASFDAPAGKTHTLFHTLFFFPHDDIFEFKLH